MIKNSILSGVANVVHGFGTRDDEMADIFSGYWSNRPVQHERHGTRIAVISHAQEDCGEADGMLTDQPGLLLCIATADCAPVLLARKDGQAVAALHVGWRGALDGIVQQFAALLDARGENAGNWAAAIGPTAGPCCYEVSDEIIQGFRERYDMAMDVVAPGPRRLNLASIIQSQLHSTGLNLISAAPECTICCRKNRDEAETGFAFHSYRRDRETRSPGIDVQWSAIAISQ